MDEVLPDLGGKVAADRAGGGGNRVGDAHQATNRLDGAVTFGNDRDQWATSDEVHQLAEERLALVLAVVLACGLPVERALLEGDDREALPLEPTDNLTDQPPTDTIRLDKDKGSLRHAQRLQRAQRGA